MISTHRFTARSLGRLVAVASLGMAAIVLGGCCHIPPGCCQIPASCCNETVYTITITKPENQCVISPGDSTEWALHPGTKIKFVNATEDQVKVIPSYGAYDEGNEFSVEPYQSIIRTVAAPGQDPDDHIILHTVECGGDDHGGPKMVVTEPPGGGGTG